MHPRLAIASFVVLGASGGCGGSSCPIGLIEQLAFYPGITVGCCGAFDSRDVRVSHPDAELDLAFQRAQDPAPLVHVWLTSTDCGRLFDGTYPPASGSPAPLCATYLGPVSQGEVSPRRKLPPGTYRVWAQAFSSSPAPQQVPLQVGIWGPQCDRPPL